MDPSKWNNIKWKRMMFAVHLCVSLSASVSPCERHFRRQCESVFELANRSPDACLLDAAADETFSVAQLKWPLFASNTQFAASLLLANLAKLKRSVWFNWMEHSSEQLSSPWHISTLACFIRGTNMAAIGSVCSWKTRKTMKDACSTADKG